jgi:hypothetical protein
VAFSTFTVAGILRVLDLIQEGFAPTWYRIGLGFQVAEYLILVSAFVLVGIGFLGARDQRARRMSLAAMAAATAFLTSVTSYSIQAGVYNDTHHVLGTLVATYVVAAIGAAFLLGAAATVALATAGAAPLVRGDRKGIRASRWRPSSSPWALRC